MTPDPRLVEALRECGLRVAKVNPDRWMAQCPHHEDRHESLSIRRADNGDTLVHCFAGCEVVNVLAACGLDWGALFADAPETPRLADGARPRRRRQPSRAAAEAQDGRRRGEGPWRQPRRARDDARGSHRRRPPPRPGGARGAPSPARGAPSPAGAGPPERAGRRVSTGLGRRPYPGSSGRLRELPSGGSPDARSRPVRPSRACSRRPRNRVTERFSGVLPFRATTSGAAPRQRPTP